MKTILHKILAFIQSALSDDQGGGSNTRLMAFIFCIALVVVIFAVIIFAHVDAKAIAQIPDWIHNTLETLIISLTGGTVLKAGVNKIGGNNTPPTP